MTHSWRLQWNNWIIIEIQAKSCTNGTAIINKTFFLKCVNDILFFSNCIHLHIIKKTDYKMTHAFKVIKAETMFRKFIKKNIFLTLGQFSDFLCSKLNISDEKMICSDYSNDSYKMLVLHLFVCHFTY